MKYLNILACAVMVLFAAVQYNDPDAPLWIAIYLIPAFWCALVAFRPRRLRGALPMAGLALSVAAAVLGTVYYWPDVAGWWRSEVWWEVETAREGMGMMIATAAMVIALVSAARARRRRS